MNCKWPSDTTYNNHYALRHLVILASELGIITLREHDSNAKIKIRKLTDTNHNVTT